MVDPASVWHDPRLGAQISADRFRLAVGPATVPTRPPVQTLLAGVAEVDITPPPGMPKAGHSKNAQDGNGFRTRLKARVVHLRAGGSSVALVALDLLAGSAVVQHAVARLLDDTDVGIDGLFLAATHTHAGPGQYSGSRFYNDWASNRPGFDPGYTGFLVDRLADGVRTAVTGRRPASAAIGMTEVRGLTRNRSLGAYVLNEGLADRRTDAQRRYAAIDPRLHLLRVDDADGPLAAFTWFSIHGTGISSHDPSTNADVWAYLNGELADRVERRTGRRPVSAAAVASHGDMTPAVVPGMLVFPEAERVGRGIGAAAAALHESLGDRLDDRFAVDAVLEEIDLRERPERGGVMLEAPRIGWAKAAGAGENTTPVIHRIPPFKPGWGSRSRAPQGAKRIAGTPLGHARFVGRDDDFPEVLGLHLLRLGDALVLGLPFETCIEPGRRIAAALASSDLAPAYAFVSSLVNDQCDYLTTAEEYAAQYYEGASTLFGPRQEEWVSAAARSLAARMAQGQRPDVPARSFDFGVHRYLAGPTGATVTRECGSARFVEATATERAFWEMPWTDVPPGDLAWHEPLIRVEAEGEDGSWSTARYDGRPVDDQGWRLGIAYEGARGGRHHYRARWFGPPLGLPIRHRFVLLANAGQAETVGPAFD
jgi:neutral ceramidase